LFFASGARQVLVEDESAQGVVPAQSVADQVGSPLVDCTYGNRESAKAVVRTAVEMLDGALDVLVLAAEANYSTGASDQLEDEWAEILRVNLTGSFQICQEMIPYLSDQTGRVIMIGSLSGQIGGPQSPAYAASKAGLMAMTHNLARFVGDRGITVNCISPGILEEDTVSDLSRPDVRALVGPEQLLRYRGKSKDVAELVMFLSSDSGRWISAQTFGINGGQWTSGF
jgi:NAD(P)-dependent dehydrogenase (short-subunit alcohol dehydrogenase family)